MELFSTLVYQLLLSSKRTLHAICMQGGVEVPASSVHCWRNAGETFEMILA